MPNTPSAIKRLKQSTKRRLHNRITKKVVKTFAKRTLAAVHAKEFEKAEADFRATVAKIDKAGLRRVLHPNTAARRKSKFTRDYQAAARQGQGLMVIDKWRNRDFKSAICHQPSKETTDARAP